jgi:hypothetical protein
MEDGDPVTEIGWKYDPDGGGAFSGTGITEIIIPDTIKSIGYYAFQDCPNLTSITFPASVEYINMYVLKGNRDLKNIIVEAGNPNYIAENGILYQIGEEIYEMSLGYGNKLLHSWPSASGDVTIPADVTIIGIGALWGTNIKSIVIPEGVTRIDYQAFANSSLSSVTIPKSVKYIGANLFMACASLTSITVAADNPYYSSDGGILYETNNPFSGIMGKVLYTGQAASGNVTIPADVAFIEDFAFTWNTNLTGVTIPEGLTYIGNVAFGVCTSVESITIPASVTSIGNEAFSMWTSSQTIYVKGHTSQAAADAAWGVEWRQEGYSDNGEYGGDIKYRDIKATIKYWNGSSYQ